MVKESQIPPTVISKLDHEILKMYNNGIFNHNFVKNDVLMQSKRFINVHKSCYQTNLSAL